MTADAYVLVMAIVEAASEFRDADWNHDNSHIIERLDAAVDAWREHFRAIRPKRKELANDANPGHERNRAT
jgi:hypothetical protein